MALPDISLAPILASYFGVSMDELFDFHLAELEQKVDVICKEAYQYRESDPQKSREILEAGLTQYPDNDILLNNLLYVINYTEIVYLLEGREKFEAAEKQKWISFENLLQMMQKLAECHEAEGNIEKAIEETEAALQLLPILKKESFDIYVDFF